MDDIKRKLKDAWNENPIALIGVSAFAITALAKLIEAANHSRNTRSWDRETRRRDRKDRRGF